MFEKVLIANRGEIALRIHRACREMGIRTVAVHSEADANAMHVRLADEAVCIGPARSADSYLNKSAIISAAIVTGADAIHPGFGFLSENADFAEMVESHGITFIGPTAAQMRKMGDKITARQAAIEAGLPVTPGSPSLDTVEDAKKWANEIGYPVIIKAKDGGGGKGMKVAFSDDDITEAYTMARAEAKAAFPSDVVYMEKYLQKPRHIEMQILADKYGNVVHLGERDCSIQRNNQKVIEESPSPALNQAQREEIGEIVRKAIEKIGYFNAGTLEFLFEDGKFYFLEMNTRLQVEHPVTEAVSGIDIVREQIRIASGAALGYEQKDIKFNGHAIECRINAENPETFTPCPGKITEWHAPGGLGVRVDSEIYSGYSIPPFYDSMIAKLIVHGHTRNSALMRVRRALEEFVIDGVSTTIPLHQEIISQAEYIDGMYNIHWLEEYMKSRKTEK
ncbi:MAG: acetyl-CoA carboxylase biotin carboxylase subunit [Alphaproteobacteria bacterium]|nr:acetyl-CoA carboxylase biotin carboxylase subunit [Alphaproteobacteria bacterium]MBQ8784778.1 acetyl-CoA carboxylase biotin carboxylase subunit [Alphaproteobacteria bacterium]